MLVCLVSLVLLWIFFPRLFRTARASLFLMWKKVRLPAGVMTERVKLPAKVSADHDMLVHGALPGVCTVQWAVRCVTGRARNVPGLNPDTFGHLVSVKEHPGALVFIGRRWFRLRPVLLRLAGGEVQHESGYLSENLVIYNKSEKQQAAFRFTRAEEALAARLEDELHGRRQRAGAGHDFPPPAVADEVAPPQEGEGLALPPVILEAPAPPAAVPEFFAPNDPISPFPAAPTEVPAPPAPGSPAELPAIIAGVPPMPPTSDPPKKA
jgi:hypothetical protein